MKSILIVILTAIISGCNPDQRDPVVLEYRQKFYEVGATIIQYQKNLNLDIKEGEDYRIFPDNLHDLHKWSKAANNARLISEQDWKDFESGVDVIYSSYSELEKDGIDPDTHIGGTTVILRKKVTGKDGKKYNITLRLCGIVAIELVE